MGRLLLFIIDLKKQADNGYGQNADLYQIRICNHDHPPFLYRVGGKKLPPFLKQGGLTAYRYWQRLFAV